MGIERHLYNTYLCTSNKLGKKWVVRAPSVEDATGKVLSFCRKELQILESLSPNSDIDVDLSFLDLEEDVVEI